MDKNIFVSYTEDGKELLELVQEWVDENINNLSCQIIKSNIKSKLN